MSNSWMFSDRIGLFMVYAPNFCMPEYVVQRVIFHSIICRLADCRLGQNPNFCLSFLLILKNGRERKCLVVKRSKYSKATHKILLLGQLHGKVLTHVFLEGATIIGRQDAPLRNEGALRLAKFDPCGAERRTALHALCRQDEVRRHLFKTTHSSG